MSGNQEVLSERGVSEQSSTNTAHGFAADHTDRWDWNQHWGGAGHTPAPVLQCLLVSHKSIKTGQSTPAHSWRANPAHPGTGTASDWL